MLTAEREWTRDLATHRKRAAAATPVLTLALMGALMSLALIQMYVGLPESVQRAALVKSRVLAGEWWRPLTAALLHGSGVHLSSNLAVLAVLGELVETYVPRTGIALVFLTSAIGGSIASTLLSSTTSVGASGGILGLAGYLLVLSSSEQTALRLGSRRR